jgi:hypothetical protein
MSGWKIHIFECRHNICKVKYMYAEQKPKISKTRNGTPHPSKLE